MSVGAIVEPSLWESVGATLDGEEAGVGWAAEGMRELMKEPIPEPLSWALQIPSQRECPIIPETLGSENIHTYLHPSHIPDH